MAAKSSRITGPATQPSWAIAHASDSTPDPITAVMMCADAVHTVPAPCIHTRTCNEEEDETPASRWIRHQLILNYLSSSPCRRRQVRRHGYHRHRGLACRRPWRLLRHASTSPLYSSFAPLPSCGNNVGLLGCWFSPPGRWHAGQQDVCTYSDGGAAGRPVVGRRNRGGETIYRRGDAGEGASATPTRATDRRKWSSERAQQRRVARGSGRHGEVK
jgi:hypothetical protein